MTWRAAARRLRRATVLGSSLVATGVLGSCSKTGEPRGGLMMVLSQDGTLKIDRLDVLVSFEGKSLLNRSYKLPQEAQLPSTIALVSNGDATTTATITISGWQLRAGEPDYALDRRDAFVTQIPTDRVAEYKVVLTARCGNWVDHSSGQPTCQPRGYTCDNTTGDCISPVVVASDLETYHAGDENGGTGGSFAQGGTGGSAGRPNEEAGAPDAGGGGKDGAMQGCAIAAKTYESGDKNPVNACLYCDPSANASAWSKVKDGTGCATGKLCNSGSCAPGCFIGGRFYDSGVGEPNNTTCAKCDPATSTSGWTPTSEGTVCSSNQFCHDGACTPGCFIGGTFYAPDAVNGCQTCQPAKSTTIWTPTDGIACSGGTCCANTCVNLQTSSA